MSTKRIETPIEINKLPKDLDIHLERQYHKNEDSTYWLSNDKEEQVRLAGQHSVYKVLFGGNILSNVRENLDFAKGISVLDIGCGSGVWIEDMAREFPECEYHGCDITNAISKEMNVSNFSFRQGNVVEGLPYADNTFDFVQMRLLVFALRKEDWPKAVEEVIRVVKPGGMFQFVESGFKSQEDETCAYFRFVNAVNSLAKSRKQNPYIYDQIASLVSSFQNVRVNRSDCKHYNLSSNDTISKGLRWDVIELFKSSITHIKPFLGLETEDEIRDYLKALEKSMSHDNGWFNTTYVSAQKIKVVTCCS